MSRSSASPVITLIGVWGSTQYPFCGVARQVTFCIPSRLLCPVSLLAADRVFDPRLAVLPNWKRLLDRARMVRLIDVRGGMAPADPNGMPCAWGWGGGGRGLRGRLGM